MEEGKNGASGCRADDEPNGADDDAEESEFDEKDEDDDEATKTFADTDLPYS